MKNPNEKLKEIIKDKEPVIESDDVVLDEDVSFPKQENLLVKKEEKSEKTVATKDDVSEKTIDNTKDTDESVEDSVETVEDTAETIQDSVETVEEQEESSDGAEDTDESDVQKQKTPDFPELDEEEEKAAEMKEIPLPEDIPALEKTSISDNSSKSEEFENTEKVSLEEINTAIREQEESDEESDEDYDDYDDYDDGSLSTPTKVLLGVIIVVIIAAVGFLAYNLWQLNQSVNVVPPSSDDYVEIYDSSNEKNKEDKKVEEDDFTFYQENMISIACQNKLKEIYDSGDYVVPSTSSMKLSGTPKDATVEFILWFTDNTSANAVMNVSMSENTSECIVNSVNIGGKDESTILQETKKKQEEKKVETTPTPTPVSTEPVLTQSYSEHIDSSIEVTLEVNGEGEAYVEAVSEDGTVTRLASQDYSGGGITTTQLEAGNYSINLYATSGCNYSWSYSSN